MRSPNRTTLLSVEALDDRTLQSGLLSGLLGTIGGVTSGLGLPVIIGGGGQTPTSPPPAPTPPPTTPPPAPAPVSLAGHVFYDDGSSLNAFSGVKISLLDAEGAVVATATTDEMGLYSFTGLAAGTYTIVEGTVPFAFSYADGPDHVGTVNGQQRGESSANDEFTVTLASGESGINYDFIELLQG